MAGNPQMLNKFFDVSTREDIANIVDKFISGKDREISVLTVGSPNAWECKSIKNKNKVNILALDKESATNFDETKKTFKSGKFIKSDFFNYKTDIKFDIIVNRWFLHHLNTIQKKRFLKRCREMLRPGGILICVDYFLTKFEGMEERVKSGLTFLEYRRKFVDQPSKEKFETLIRKSEKEDFRGAKMDSMENFIEFVRGANFSSYLYKYTTDANKVDNPEHWGHYIIYCEK